MTLALIAALIIGGFLHSWFHDRAHDRLARSTDQWISALTAMDDRHAATFTQQATEHRTEVQALLQRIQAPQAAVAEHHALAVPATPDDGLPLSDDEIAELQERQRVIDWMEAVENGTADTLDGVPQ